MSSENPTTFLNRLNESMREKGISPESLMESVSGIGPVRLAQLFKGEWQPSIFIRQRIAKVLGCSLEWLMGETEDPTPIKTESSSLVVECSYPGFYRWLTDRRYMGMKPPWDPQGRTFVGNVPAWFYVLDNAVTEGCDENNCTLDLTDLEIQVISNWIRHRSARRRQLSMSLFAPGPKVIELDQAKARLRGVYMATGVASY